MLFEVEGWCNAILLYKNKIHTICLSNECTKKQIQVEIRSTYIFLSQIRKRNMKLCVLGAGIIGKQFDLYSKL